MSRSASAGAGSSIVGAGRASVGAGSASEGAGWGSEGVRWGSEKAGHPWQGERYINMSTDRLTLAGKSVGRSIDPAAS